MVNLERIANVLIENVEQLRHKSSLDMSMFPKEQVPEIYSKAAEGTFQRRDFESTSHYLFLGKKWDKLLEWGTPLYHSKSEEERGAGRHFLKILATHDKLPKDLAVELANDMLSEEHPDYFKVARALYSGGAVTRAEELANQLLNEGMYEDGIRFLAVAGKKISNKEREKYSEVALEKGRQENAFKFYEGLKLPIPNDRAKAIVSGTKNDWLFHRVVEHMDKTKNSFTPQDFKEFGNKFFEDGNHEGALENYKRAGETVQPEEYRIKGEHILSQSKKIESERSSWSSEQAMPSVRTAFDYLSRYSIEGAKQRIAKYADSLFKEDDFARIGSNISQFGKLYEMIGVPIPVDKALIAAQIAEKKGEYNEAAKYYVAAGMKDVARRVGDMALQSDDSWQKDYGAKECFQAADDKEGLAIIEFLDKNKRCY